MPTHLNLPRFIGVTGTNGKTTVTWLVAHVLRQAGQRCALIGTLTGKLTTPSPWHLQRLIRRFKAFNYDWVVMEVSSHGIHQNRIKGIDFAVKALTNITQDHLDYHQTMAAYQQVKLGWLNSGNSHKITFWPDKLQGSFREQNKALAREICLRIGLSPALVDTALTLAPPVPGRFEEVALPDQSFRVFIDFAHTPDGLKNILQEARHLLPPDTQGHLWVVFGCGGDRDHGKRPQMGAIASQLADRLIITSDNPRSEEPQRIMEDIREGLPPKANNKIWIKTIVDRRVAIHYALNHAKADDIIVIAGKGHETYQIFKDKTIHFNDQEVVLAFR